MIRDDDPRALPSTREGGSVPALTLAEFRGDPPFSVEDLAKGDVVLVNFWASWCAPCRVEHPHLTALAEEGIVIYGVNYKDQPGNALKFLDELGDPYTAIGSDQTGRMALDWGLYGVPETYVIDADGRVVLRFPGPITQRVMDSQIRPAIERAQGG